MKSTKKWFTLAFSIILLAIFSIISIPILNLISSNNKIWNYLSTSEKKDRFWAEISYYFRKSLTNNSDWSTTDNLSCPDVTNPSFIAWIRTFWESSTVCSTTESAWSDLIQDDADNNDYKCNYYNFSESSKVSWSSKKCDNDDEHRKSFIWVIFPNETKTVFYSSEESNWQIWNNTNNIDANFSFPKRISEVNNGNIYFDFSHWNFIGELYSFPKSFIENWIVNIESETQINKSGSGLSRVYLNTLNNIDNSWSVRNFDFTSKNYVLNLTNTGNNLLYFTSYVEESWEKAYIVPFRDDLTKKELIFGYFIEEKWNLVFKSQIYEE